MRYKLSIQLSKNSTYIDYRYKLGSWVYSTIKRGDSEHSEELHKRQSYKFYTFSSIVPSAIRRGVSLLFPNTVEIVVSFLELETEKAFLAGVFADGTFRVGTLEGVVVSVEAEKLAVFSDMQEFRAMTPIFVKKGKKDIGPDNPDYLKILKHGIFNKTGHVVEELNILSDVTSSLHIIKKRKHKGYMYDFRIKTNPESLNIIYLGGVGGNTASLGFGYLKSI